MRKQLTPEQLAEFVFTDAVNLFADEAYSEAEDRLKQATKLNPNHTHAHRYLGYVYKATNRLDHAIKELVTALNTDTENHFKASTCKHIAACFANLGYNEAAEKYLLEAIDVDPEDSSLRLMLGEAYEWQGYEDLAVSQYEHALLLNDSCVHSLCNLATIYQKRRKLRRVLSYLLQARDKNPKHSAPLIKLCKLFDQLDWKDRRKKTFMRLFRLFPDHEVFHRCTKSIN